MNMNEEISDRRIRDSYLITKTYNPDDYTVTVDDLYKYIGKNRDIAELYEHKRDDGKVIFYIINYKDGGYEIVSGDKRTYPTLASSQVGNIDIHTDNENFDSWIECTSNLFNLLESSDSLTAEMSYNINTWKFIVGEKRVYETKSSTTYYYLIDFTTESRYIFDIGPLLITKWGQSNYQNNDNYWNKYCPWKDSSMSGSRCPVGCVAVSGGQFAYYMKDIVDMNITMPISADCAGYAGNYTRYFSSSMSSSMIYNMPLDYHETSTTKIENARIFLAYTGHLLNMQYSPDGSSASTQNLTNVFSQWGLDTYYVDYADTTIRARLVKNTPVIARGSGENGGHSWVIDGYRQQRTLRRNYYYMSDVELTTEEISELTMDDWNAYDEWYLLDTKTYHMNWGWNGNSDGWYLIDDWSTGNYSFMDGRKLLVSYKH